MARAKLITPVHHIHPRCDSKLGSQSTKWKNAHWKRFNHVEPDRCTNTASVHIDGKDLCKKHASMVALEILLNEGDE
ncbi:hypothetical protein KAR91_47870 [Candidatus Pacearchaeota archaeon]|nr:hypothetical protein [Candidatus Pacearchaeota archaeon]